jgi:flavin-dependent dehydrogenase
MFTRPDMGWIWFIPLSESAMSVGAVVPQAVHRLQTKATPEESLESYLAETPAAALLLQRARRISPDRLVYGALEEARELGLRARPLERRR